MTGPELGGKAAGLLALRRAGEQVPEFVVIPPDYTVEQITTTSTQLSEVDCFAVRSSAPDEDGVSAKAGHYLTELGIPRDHLAEAVIRVRHSAAEPIAVIIQAMVAATVSGVAFSADPTGILDLVVISAGSGIGAVVANDRPTITCARSRVDGRGWTTAEAGAPVLSNELLARIEQAAVRIEADRGQPIDLEWAWQAESDQLWILQARPITTLAQADQICLDNSNIVENYPGLVLPMTAAFVPETYRAVFTALAERLCPHPRLLQQYRPIVAAMVQANSGRMYYRLEHWYQVMALMPFSAHYVRIWQRSLGVAEGGRPVRLPSVGRLTRLRVTARLLRELIRTPAELAGLSARVEQAARSTRARLATVEHPAELRPLYQQLIDDLVGHWDLTLLNDVRAFVFGALTSRIDPAAGRAAVSGQTTVESLRPLAELASLAERTRAEGHDLASLIDHAEDSAQRARSWLSADDPLRRDIAGYIDRYGDRWLEELKLESPTLRTDPVLAITALSSELRVHVPEPVPAPRNPLARWLAAAAGQAVALRESSRLDRSRVHALVREIALQGGELLAAAGWIDQPSDVFWLRLEEVFSTDGDRRQLISSRRADHQSWSRLPAFRRLTFAGEPVDLHVPGGTSELRTTAGGTAGSNNIGPLVGQGVSRGIGRGRVRLVDDPRTLDEMDGAVLVTAATDPGWVFLLPRCAAVVAERGSMLSHTSIVARELGVPVVVGAADATTRLCEGDLVEVDGHRGSITVLEDD